VYVRGGLKRFDARWFGLLMALACFACRSPADRTLRDTEARSWSAHCDAQMSCQLKLVAGEHAPDKKDFALHVTGNLVGICDVDANKKVDATTDCRPLVCQGDDDCPPMHGLMHGTCINGLCREPAGTLGVDDAVMLCLAGTGLGITHPDRLPLAFNCGSPCKVPSACRQP